MKRKKKLGVFPLVLLLLLWLPMGALGAEEDPYVLSSPAEPGGKPYIFVTPFAVEHTVPGRNGGQGDIRAPRIYCLSGEEGRPIAAYIADAGAEDTDGARYRRINLEDSTRFSNTVAGKLRSIVENSFPNRSLRELQENANQWLAAMELPEVGELQSGEAILASQIAIWKSTGGNGYSVNKLYGGWVDQEDLREKVIYTEELSQMETERTETNIAGLYTYFCNLPPMSPTGILASDGSITRTVYSCVQETGEAYTAQVSVTVKAAAGEEDRLVLTAYCEDQTQERQITEEGEYTFTFSGLGQRSAVRLVLHGKQRGADVYLFETKGEDGPPLLGYDSSILPVFCERILTPVPSNPSAVPGKGSA